jgi:hypothetical protein
MERPDVVWTQPTSRGDRQILSAVIQDKDRNTWEATITSEPYAAGVNKLTVNLFCRTAGRLQSTNTVGTIDDAKSWCYTTLGME